MEHSRLHMDFRRAQQGTAGASSIQHCSTLPFTIVGGRVGPRVRECLSVLSPLHRIRRPEALQLPCQNRGSTSPAPKSLCTSPCLVSWRVCTEVQLSRFVPWAKLCWRAGERSIAGSIALQCSTPGCICYSSARLLLIPWGGHLMASGSHHDF